ncbi:uroporphyrinogen-III synthase [Oceanicoccus sp. KOV_DT_Chl]|uniref:uroporphyrinogen-III synthase n=1 Tax=Oceanicoccus sp. KOV_DT_Chl TaxID=1904639 RepID=UPI000C799FAF|nr:uroporphyrinogen-III synthase [Oceanicoccus sp. KOV_DT_Chl]
MVTSPAAALSSIIKQQKIDIICVNSTESLQSLMLLAADELSTLQSQTVLVPGLRVAEFARQQGFTNIIVADNASDQAVLARLLSLAK